MRCVALFPLGNMQHFQEGFNRLSQTLFWTRVELEFGLKLDVRDENAVPVCVLQEHAEPTG